MVNTINKGTVGVHDLLLVQGISATYRYYITTTFQNTTYVVAVCKYMCTIRT